MTTPAKAPITTHVLDQISGKPAVGVNVILSKREALHGQFVLKGQTDSDGRILNWDEQLVDRSEENKSLSINQLIQYEIDHSSGQQSVWDLRFAVEDYFSNSGKPTKYFWESVTLSFWAAANDEKKHWHVPLLLGPFGYTTYRGS